MADSAAYLQTNASSLARYRSVEDLVLVDETDATARGLEHHLRVVRSAIARELWTRQIFIGISVLDELLFHAAAAGGDPVLGTLSFIRGRRLDRPGLVLYPLHSFGIVTAGLSHLARESVSIHNPEFGFAVSPQTNSMDKTLRFLEASRWSLGIGKRVPDDLIEHWHRSRDAEWIVHNPLLVLRTRSLPGYYYDNQFLVIGRIKIVVTLIAMLGALQPPLEGKDRFWSSSQINNWETLDIHHYITLFDAPGTRAVLSGSCVPMNVDAASLAELSQLNVEVDPRALRRRRTKVGSLYGALNAAFEGYLRCRFNRRSSKASRFVYTKFMESLTYYRRSFHGSDPGWRSVLSLAIAYEMLLTDHYAGGVANRIHRRAGVLLKGVPGVRALLKSIDDLFVTRNEIVHGDLNVTPADVLTAQRAFVFVFEELVNRASATTSLQPSEPIRQLVGQ